MGFLYIEMKRYPHILLILVWLFLQTALHAFTVSPTCPDFTNITAPYTEAAYGTTFDPFEKAGIVDGRHTEITTQGTDPNTGNLLNLLPAGESKVIRLGNEQIGGEAEALTYHFVVDKYNPVLLVKFAVVFEDPGHGFIEQPRFVMRIMDKNGNLIEDCAEYDVSAREGIDGFQSYNGKTVPIRWRDWTNVGLDMSSFAGKEVQVQFITYDCRLLGHFGYAYFTASCIPNKLKLTACAGNSFSVEAPADFASYEWDNGDKTRLTTRTKTSGDMSLSCLVTSATSCQFRLSAFVSSTISQNQDIEIEDEICEGQPYTKNYFNLPAQNKPGTFTYYNTFLNPNTCVGDITTTLRLTVHQQYFPINVSICQGENYVLNGFNIQNPAVGMRKDTLFFKSKTTGCDSIICLDLTVNASFDMPNSIIGNTTPCTNELVDYSFNGNSALAKYNWQVPDNAVIIGGNSNIISVYFTDDTAGDIILKGENGCGTGAVPLHIRPKRSYNNFYTDTVCTGDVYNKYGFNLGVQNTVGYYSFEHKFHTALGCDSTTALALYVFPTPKLNIELQGDSILCNKQNITLHVIADDNPISFAPKPAIAIGDILCTDGTTEKPENFVGSGKTADGIIFYVDNTGNHGWALSLKNEPGNPTWSNTYTDVPGLNNIAAGSMIALTDIDGYGNTQKMRTALPNTTAAWSMDISQGWYLPAIGQLRVLFGILEDIDASLKLVGGDKFIVSDTQKYWSSTEYSSAFCWILGANGAVVNEYKTLTTITTRAVKSF